MLLAAVLALALVIAVIAYKYTGDFTVLVEQTGTFAKEGVVEADIESREDDNSLAATRTAWVLGFITAFNQYRSKPDGDVSGGKDTEVLMARIDDYCKWHPLDNLYNASAALVDELRQ
jgi:hypothetical protein